MKCQCVKCSCNAEFVPVDREKLLNTIQHGRLEQKQIDFAMKRLDSKICENCFVGIHYKKRLRNIRNSPEIKDAPMFASIIEQEAMKSYKATSILITKITDGLQSPESLQTIESELPLIEKALTCYQSDIKKTDTFYTELIQDKNTANADYTKIKSALDKITSYD